MVEFEIENGKLITFLEKCACKGVVLVTASGKITRNFFNKFYLDAVEGGLIVKAIDSEEQKMYIRHFLKDVDVDTMGTIAITDSDSLVEVLKAIPRGRTISFKEDKSALIIETIDDGTYYGFKLRQIIPSDETQTALEKSKFGVAEWDEIHVFDDSVPKITVGGQSAWYDTVIYFTKGELQKVVSDSVKLTRDQDLTMKIKPRSISFSSGKKSDNIISDIRYDKEVIAPCDGDFIITNLHPIVNHLFPKVIFFCRVAKEDGALKFWIQSGEGDIELNFCSASV